MFFWNSLAFCCDPTDVNNLISGSSAFERSLNIWIFSVHILLKPSLENFEHYFASVWSKCNFVVVWTFFGIAFLWDWNENWPFPALWSLLSLEDIKRWQEYTEELYKKGLTDSDNHNDVITHLEPDILGGKVKWALGSITRTKLVDVMKFQLSYFKSSKMMLWKCCTQYARKFGKFSSGHRTGKGQFSFQSQRKAMPKSSQTTTQLHSSHMLAK